MKRVIIPHSHKEVNLENISLYKFYGVFFKDCTLKIYSKAIVKAINFINEPEHPSNFELVGFCKFTGGNRYPHLYRENITFKEYIKMLLSRNGLEVFEFETFTELAKWLES